MEVQVSEMVTRLAELPPVAVYLVVALISFLEYLLPPVPGDAVVVFAGAMAGLGLVSGPLVVLLGATSGACGFMTVYWLGSRLGDMAEGRRSVLFFSADDIERGRRWITRWGSWLVVTNRLFSGIRSVIALVAGMGAMPRRRTATLSFVGALAWAALLVAAGYLVGDRWEEVSGYLARYGLVVMAFVLGYFVLQIWRRHRRSRGEP